MTSNRAWKSQKLDFWGGFPRRERRMTSNQTWRPQITPFCHQMGRRSTIWDLGTVPRGRISLRISPGGSHPLNLNFFFHHLGASKCPNVNFCEFFENGLPQPGRIWAHARHGSRTPQATHATAHARPRGVPARAVYTGHDFPPKSAILQAAQPICMLYRD